PVQDGGQERPRRGRYPCRRTGCSATVCVLSELCYRPHHTASPSPSPSMSAPSNQTCECQPKGRFFQQPSPSTANPLLPPASIVGGVYISVLVPSQLIRCISIFFSSSLLVQAL